MWESNTTLPTNGAILGGSEPTKPLQATPRRPGVLVVDDEVCVRDLLKTTMEQRGLAAWLAAGGREAIALYGRSREFIDVVLLDVRMPGLDGPQTLAALREVDPHLRCCFMTGDAGDYEVSDLLACGALHVFNKPFQLTEIIRVVQRLAHETTGKVQEI